MYYLYKYWCMLFWYPMQFHSHSQEINYEGRCNKELSGTLLWSQDKIKVVLIKEMIFINGYSLNLFGRNRGLKNAI